MFAFIDAGGWFAHLFTLALPALNSMRGALPVSAAHQPKSSFKARHLLDPVETLPDLSQKNEDHENDHCHPE